MDHRPLKWVFRGLALAAASVGLVATTLPASANQVPGGRLTMQKSSRTPTIQHLGAANMGASRGFTVFLNKKSAADAAKVATYFRRFGMTATVLRNNKSISVYGTNAQAAAAGRTSFERVRVAAETFVRTVHDPQFPSSIAPLIAATSMSPGPRMKAMNVRSFAEVHGSQLGYGPADVANLYDINPVYGAGITGSGRTIDIAACDDIDQADVNYFESFYGLPNTQINVIPVDGPRDGFNSLEPALDVERVISTAPGAAVNLYVVPDCTFSEFADMINQIAIDGGADAVSTSYGQFESVYGAFGFGADMIAQHKALEEVVKDDGIPFFAASGDTGSWCGSFFCPFFENFTDALYPASDSYVISVGATTAELSTINTRLIEYTWGGSGGSVSGVFGLPSWQKNYPGLASGQFKNLPDVSMVGDPNTGLAVAWLVAFPPPIFPVGGTSASSPTFAAIMALVGQNRAMHGHGQLTNAGNAIFAAHGTFHDITQGDNGFYAAKAGYDNTTGLGVPDVFKLVKALQ